MQWSRRLIGLTAALVVTVFCRGDRPMMLKAQPVLRRHGPIRIQRQPDNGKWESTNWSGYAITTPKGSSLPNGSVTDIKGSWRVPSVTCSGSPLAAPSGYASFWVGIDGWTSNTVEQIGTDSDCVDLAGTQTGTPTYYAWFEFFPKNGFVIGDYDKSGKCNADCVQPGDNMWAEVRSATGETKDDPIFEVPIVNLTEGWFFRTSSPVHGAKQSSAEWIAETPCCQNNGDLEPLANFGFVDYDTSLATVKGVTGSIQSFGDHVQEVTLVSEGDTGGSPAGTVMAQPSVLMKDGNSFAVHWQNSGP